jgi:hypothetical protein
VLYSRYPVLMWLLVDNLSKLLRYVIRAKAKKVVSKYSHKYVSLVLGGKTATGYEALSLLTRWGTTNPDFKSLPG